MERSLSVLLPVRDAQSTLANLVLEILEILPDLTSQFELIVIDDGSLDATVEVADDLAARYPQVRAIRHAQPQGRPAAIRTGLQHSSGDVIFLRDPSNELALDQVYKLWWAIDEHPLVLGRSTTTRRHGQWVGWKRRGGDESFRMVDRRAIQAVQESLEAQAQLITSMTPQDDPWFEVEVCRRGTAGPVSSRKHEHKKNTAGHERRSPRLTKSPSGKLPGPKYLRSLKNFALGE
ncbi:MAG: glycosyltransferase family 2 protein [Pirellulales bacterium]|nr:glycosyltransferase family 2 protein [Pirellulales bacterium]